MPVIEVRTVERVERAYRVKVGNDVSDPKQYAQDQVQGGEIDDFIEGNAEIEEITSVRQEVDY